MTEFTKTTTTTFKVHCPDCENDHIVKVGVRNGEQRYQCKACKKKFRAGAKAEGRKMDADMMGSAIRDYYTGKSYKQIAEGLKEEYDLEKEPSKATIYEWVRDYTAKAVKQMKDHPAKTGGHWVADEMAVKIDAYGKPVWLWNVMDSETRYILASHITPRRDAQAAKVVLRKALAAADKPPKTITTDKLKSYSKPIRELMPEAKHMQSQGMKADINNNLSERLQGTFRDRIKTLRSMSSRQSAQRYLDGWVLNYNHFKGHHSLRNKTPASKAKTGAPFEEWADVVKAEAAPRAAVKTTLKAGARPEDKKKLDLNLPSQSRSPRRTAARQPAVRLSPPKKRVGPRVDKPRTKAKPKHLHPMVRLRAAVRREQGGRATPRRRRR